MSVRVPFQPATSQPKTNQLKSSQPASLSKNQSIKEQPRDVYTNEAWVYALRGDLGDQEQQQAHTQLCDYLFTTALYTLWKQRLNVHRLNQYGPDEMHALAKDFVQQFCQKLILNEYAVLNSYKGEGRFLAWAVQVMRNLIYSELRRREWHESERLDAQALYSQKPLYLEQANRPEVIVQRNQLAECIERALNRLSSKNQTIFFRFILDGERADVVAEELDITAAGVYTAAHRIRERLSKQLIDAGYA